MKEIAKLFSVGSSKCTQYLPGLNCDPLQWWILSADLKVVVPWTQLLGCVLHENSPSLYGKAIHARLPSCVTLWNVPRVLPLLALQFPLCLGKRLKEYFWLTRLFPEEPTCSCLRKKLWPQPMASLQVHFHPRHHLYRWLLKVSERHFLTGSLV